MSSIPEQSSAWPAEDEVSTKELARRQGVRPVTSIEEILALAQPDAWESDEEFRDFLADLYASRHEAS